ncbi:MAG: alpha/beta hydrolase [Micropruina sp.]|nr:alpha/beta hydrolase [Micropruina sp.]
MKGADGDIGMPSPSESFPPLDGVEHRFVELPGLRVHVAEAGAGEPLILLHGFPEHWWGWRKVIPALAEHYHLVAPDLRGAGWTDAPGHGYTEGQLVADVVALLDTLGLDRVHLVGLDIGGILGYRLCLDHPERVRRFICIAAPHPYPALSVRALLRLLAKVWRLWPRFVITLPYSGLGSSAGGDSSWRVTCYLRARPTPMSGPVTTSSFSWAGSGIRPAPGTRSHSSVPSPST